MNPNEVRRRLQGLSESPLVDLGRIPGVDRDALRPAAVLLALTEIDEIFHVVFTRRPDTMPEHSGEVSLPGGGAEPEDESPLQTALRETWEEIALLEDDVEVYGALVQMPTITGYEITAFVGEFPQPYELQPDPREIESLFLAPLPALMDPANHRCQKRTWQGLTFDLHFYDFPPYTIWGATGHIVYEFLTFLDS